MHPEAKAKMSEDQFFKELRALKLKWGIPGVDAIRCTNGDCPIIALARSKWPLKNGLSNGNWVYWGRRLGLDAQDIGNIVMAADRGDPDVKKKLRIKK